MAGAFQTTTAEEAEDVVAASTAVGGPGTVDGTAGCDGLDAGPAPAEVVAVTVKVYGVALVSPATVQLVVDVLQDDEPGDDVTVYPVIAAPPFDAGGVHDTTDRASAFEVAVTERGAPGRTAGVADGDGAEALPAPTALVAATVKVYAVPLVRPVTVQAVEAVAQVRPAGVEVTV